MLAYTEALTKVLEATCPLPPIEQSLQKVHSKQILAEPIYARLDLPPADTATMDGFAFDYCGQQWKTPLQIIGFIPAGQKFNRTVGADEAVRIMTGAPLPKGCDTVVPFEHTEQQDSLLKLNAVPNFGSYVRRRGEDFHLDDQILAAGTILTPGAIGLLSAAGIPRLQVYPRPKVAILSTGDELIALGEPLQEGKIINSNAHMLAARLREEGIEPVMLGIARDCPDDLEEKLRAGLTADLLITTGGVSVGDRDLVKSVLNNLDFNKVFWKVAISPGKPILFGTIGTLPVFGLPGNPTATATTFELFIRPALRRLAGFSSPIAPRIKVRLANNLGGGRRLQQFLWGQLTIVDGALQFHPAKRRKSSQLYDLLKAHALLPLASDSPELLVGSEVEVILLRMPDSRDS